MSRLKEIENYFENLEYSFDEIKNSTFNLACVIMIYAHRNQRRVNGESYAEHPKRVLWSFDEFIGANEDGSNINREMLEMYVCPIKGTREVMLLHDVIEDTDFTLTDIKDIYEEAGKGEYFEKYMKEPLELITHKKDESYDVYIDKVLTNRAASLVKFLDLHDNMNFLSLNEFGIAEFERCKRYLNYVKQINDRYHFVENANTYRFLFRNNLGSEE